MSSFDLGIVLLSALLHAVWNIQTKASASPLAFMTLMQALSCLVLFPLLWLCDLGEVPRPVWLLLAGTGIAHGFYSFWLGMSYRAGDLSVVYPIMRSTPAFVPLAAVPLLGESISLAGAAGIALVVSGIWLVQSSGRMRLGDLLGPGSGYAYLTLLATVAYSLFDKRAMSLLETASWSGALPRAALWYVLIMLAHLPVTLLLAWRHFAPGELHSLARSGWRTLGLGALAAFASYALILQALRTSSVSYVVTARQMSVVFAVALAVFWLGERPTRPRLLGALATVAGVAAIALFG